MADKEIKKVLDDLKKKLQDQPDQPADQSDEFRKLEQQIAEETSNLDDSVKAETKELKAAADDNRAMNIAQIAKEVVTFTREKKADDASRRSFKKIEENTEKQKKHNAGAKDAREVMLKQNQIQLENDQKTAQELNEIRNTNAQILSLIEKGQRIQTDGSEGSNNGQMETGGSDTGEQLGQVSEQLEQVREQAQRSTTQAPRKGYDRLGRRRGDEHFASDEELRAARGRATTAGAGQGELGTEALDTRMADDKVAKQRLRDEAAAKRQATRVDINNLADEVETTGKSQNIRKLSARELEGEGGGLTLDEGVTIRAAGKNIRRDGEYSTGTVKLKDVDANEYTATDPLKAISEDIRISQGVIGTTRDRQQFRASTAAATISENIGNNAAQIQQAMDANPQAKEDLTKLVKAMEAQQKGEGSRKDVKVALEELKLSGGEELAGQLGLDQANKDLDGGGIGSRLKAGFKNFMGINQGTDILSGEAFGQVFDASRMFGDEGTSKIEMFRRTGDLEFKEEARRNKEVQSQVEAEQRYMGAEEGLDLTGQLSEDKKREERKQSWEDKYIPEGSQISEATPTTATQMADAAPEEAAGTGAAPKKSKREKMVSERTGQAGESIPLQQLEVLKEIRDKLDNISAGGGGGDEGDDGSIVDDVIANRRNKNKNKGKNKGGKNKPKGKMGRLASRAGGLVKGAGKFLSGNAMKIGGAALAVGAGAYTAYKGVTGAEEMADAGELTPEQEQEMKGEAVGEGVGQAGGALAGAKMGAMIGAFGGPVGAAVGGLIGGVAGFFAGGFLGKKAGGAVADVLPVNEEELKESEDQANATLEFAKEKDATLASKVEKDADDIYKQMIEEGGGEDAISDYDKRVTKNAALVKALLNNKEALQQAGIHRDGGGFLDDLESSSVVAKTGGASGATGDNIEMAQGSLSGTEGTGATLTGTPSPTGQAVENMTRLGNEADQMMQPPMVVNNTTPAPAPMDNNKLVATIKEPTVRGDTSTIQRSHDRGFLA